MRNRARSHAAHEWHEAAHFCFESFCSADPELISVGKNDLNDKAGSLFVDAFPGLVFFESALAVFCHALHELFVQQRRAPAHEFVMRRVFAIKVRCAAVQGPGQRITVENRVECRAKRLNKISQRCAFNRTAVRQPLSRKNWFVSEPGSRRLSDHQACRRRIKMLADSGGRQLPTESCLPAVRAQISVQGFSRSQIVTPNQVSGVYITVCRLLPKDIDLLVL